MASQSPARKALLEEAGWPFDVVVSRVDEDAHPEREPVKRSRELARLKAQVVMASHPGRVVVACDTVVVSQDGVLLEKTIDEDDARRMARLHSAADTLVHSSVCVISREGVAADATETATVRFARLSEGDIDWWVATGLWRGCAGGFRMEGEGARLIDRVIGDRTAVIGLPMERLRQMLKDAGWNPPS